MVAWVGEGSSYNQSVNNPQLIAPPSEMPGASNSWVLLDSFPVSPSTTGIDGSLCSVKSVLIYPLIFPLTTIIIYSFDKEFIICDVINNIQGPYR